MKRVTLTNLMAVVFVATAWSGQAADSTAPIAAPDLVFDEVDGLVVVEAEHFHKQTRTDKRAWHITSSNSAPDIQPDADPPHVAGASGGAYLDIIAVTSTIASVDGKEHSRARWARISFTPADDATKAAAAKFDTSTSSASAVAPAKPLAPLVQPRQPDGKGAVEISGELKEWHKVTLTLDGPYAHELDNEPNPFTDYDFAVTFTHESGAPSYRVPGYFAADGHAGENSAEAGTKWRAHLSPDTAGTWEYSVSFTRGKHAALDGGGAALKPFDGMSGSFRIAGTDKQGRDFRAQGRLQYAGKHHLQFAGSKEYFLKAGADAPETLLAYEDFDGTVTFNPKAPLKTWSPHLQDWKPGDPTWKDGKGKGLIGAINYLAGKGMNAFSFLTYNAGGDGDNVWPFVQRDDKFHYDCSKLDQWSIVFEHGNARGMYLHFKLSEYENSGARPQDNVSMDKGELGPERRLYLREMIARYGHLLALNWNLGEENTQTVPQQRDMAQCIHDLDPYHHLIVTHTTPAWPRQELVYHGLIGKLSALTGASVQTRDVKDTHRYVRHWVTESAKTGKPWVVANDEQDLGTFGVPPDPGYAGYKHTQGPTVDDTRKYALWATIMAGGAGVEYYFGYVHPQNDLLCEDWRSRDLSWDYARFALEFFADHRIPFWEMRNANELAGNPAHDNTRYCLAKDGEIYLVYLPDGAAAQLDLSGVSGSFGVRWLNPRAGGALRDGSAKSVRGGGRATLGNPPADPGEDWLVIVRK